jgi:hypothetical protein
MARGGCFGLCCGSPNRSKSDVAPRPASTREGGSPMGAKTTPRYQVTQQQEPPAVPVWELRSLPGSSVAIGELFGGSAGSRVHRGVVLRRSENGGGALAVAVYVSDVTGADGVKGGVMVRFSVCTCMQRSTVSPSPCMPTLCMHATVGHCMAMAGPQQATAGRGTAKACAGLTARYLMHLTLFGNTDTTKSSPPPPPTTHPHTHAHMHTHTHTCPSFCRAPSSRRWHSWPVTLGRTRTLSPLSAS